MIPNPTSIRCYKCGSVVDGFTRPDANTTVLHCPNCGEVRSLSAVGFAAMVQARIDAAKA